MYTSVVLVALSGAVVPSALAAKAPAWQSDYDAAYRQGSRDRKPIAVVFGNGPMGWENVSKEGRFNKEIHELLEAHYICVYIDKEKSAGQRLAGSFEMSEGSGLVISDHTGKYQAFRYEGELSNNDLERQLRKYADSDRTVNRTVTVLREETRYYPPSQTFTPASTYIPPAAPSPISFGSFGGAAMGRNC